MKKHLPLLMLALLACSSLNAQYNSPENKYWAFGVHAGLDFNTGAPVSVTTNINTDEGCASICDSTGHLLFYTDGRTVWNKVGAIMPGGSFIVPFSVTSATQGALILPQIGNPLRYYIFSLEEVTTPRHGRLAYCLVDMTLDGGLGDVVAGSETAMADSLFSEKMIAIPGNNGNFWLLVHKGDTNAFFAFNVDSAGVSMSPVISDIGTIYDYEIYGMKCSPDHTKIATTFGFLPSSPKGIELYDFDPWTGIVSNCQTLALSEVFYGLEFSPDNTKLYAQRASPTSEVYQYNLSLSSATAIIASKYMVAASSTNTYTDMKLAPDGKIYFKSMSEPFFESTHLDCIGSPNNTGSLCNYIAHSVDLGSNKIRYGLPNITYKIPKKIQPTGIPEVASLRTVLFPNPAHSTMAIQVGGGISSIVITGMKGEIIYDCNTGNCNNEIDVTRFPSGMYMLTVNGNTNLKFIKE